MVLSSVYLFNMFCAMVPCSVTQPPPQAFINDEVTPTPLPFSFPSQQEDDLGGEIGFRSSRPKTRSANFNEESSSRRKTRMNEEEERKILSIPGPPIFSQSSPTSNNNRRIDSVVSNLFSAVPVISVLRNNFNNFMKSVTSNNNNGGRRDGVRGARGSKNFYEPPLVKTRYGEIEGYWMGTMKGRRIAAFDGIPFAEPPIGKYRFKPPVPKYPWKNVLMAKKTGNNCLQAHPLDFFRVTGAEDCLTLNVYSPFTVKNNFYGSEEKLLPVIFLIHGGSFQYGSSAEYGPAYMLDEDVILVTANYRLGPLGFMSTGDSESPGNYGLKDQALALKWVHDSIKEFGGDNSRVTIMGQSAGGVSAQLHLISNKTTEYFKNGISLSGTAFGFWPIIETKRALELTTKLATLLNCNRRGTRELVKCLRNANAHYITAAQMQLYEWIPFHPLVLFAPVLEKEGPTSFLTRRPEDAYKSGEVLPKPWIFGQTSQEGHFDLYFMRLLMQAPSIALNGRKYLPIILDYRRKGQSTEMTNKILNYYGGALIGRGIDMNSISKMYTDRYYTSTIRKALRAHTAIAPNSTYAYVFDFKGKYNLGSLFGSPESDWGVSHTEDMFYYFNSSVYHHGLQKSDTEYGLSQIMTDFLANFVSTGKPMHVRDNLEMTFWDPALLSSNSSVPSFQYLRIRKEISMIDDPFVDRVRFWDTIGLI